MVTPVMETSMIAEKGDMGIRQEVARRAAVRHPGDLEKAASWDVPGLGSPEPSKPKTTPKGPPLRPMWRSFPTRAR